MEHSCIRLFSSYLRKQCFRIRYLSTKQNVEEDLSLDSYLEKTKRRITWEQNMTKYQPWVKDTKTAETIVGHLNKNAAPGSLLVEAFPGQATLTELLLKSQRRVVAYESRSLFTRRMEELKKTYPQSFNCTEENYYSITNKHEENPTSDNFYAHLPTVPWSWPDASPIQFVTSAVTHHRLKHHLICFAQTTGVFLCGRPEFYIVASPRIAEILVARPRYGRYRDESVIFQIFFDVKVVDQFPATSFEPQNSFQKKSSGIFEASSGYLVQLKIKDGAESIMPHFEVLNFVLFVTWAMKFKSKRVIAELEKWSQGVGFELIDKVGISIFTFFNELTPEQYLQVYHIVKSRGLENYPFHKAKVME